MRILILCTGNSCRSQMAHGFLQSFDPSLQVYSGGTAPASQVNAQAVEVMKEAGIDISHHQPTHVDTYLQQTWDYVITVCGGANENCPAFTGKVGKRIHIGFDDPSHATGKPEFIQAEFRRVRDEIKNAFARFYLTEIRKQELPAHVLARESAGTECAQAPYKVQSTTQVQCFPKLTVNSLSDSSGLLTR